MSKTGLGRAGDMAAANPTWTLLAFVATAVVAMIFLDPVGIRFRMLSAQDFAELLAPAFAAALFIERCIEVFASIARGKEAQHKRDDRDRKQRLAASANASDKERQDAEAAQEALTSFQSETQYVTLASGVALGLVLAILGVRVLEQIVQDSSLQALASWQRTGFRIFDVVVTGGLIGGGADGIHKLVSVFTTKFDQMSETNRRRGAGTP